MFRLKIEIKSILQNSIESDGISSELYDRVGKIPRNFLSQIINAGGEKGVNHVQDVLINLVLAAMYADAEVPEVPPGKGAK